MNKPFVFVSCGQFTDAEKRLGSEIVRIIKDETGYDAFFAENVHDFNGLDSNIIGALHDCAAFLTVMHPRGEISRPDGSKHVRASVWIEQEIAIATYIQRLEKRRLPVIAFIHKSVGREGIRDLLHLNPITFDDEKDVLVALPGRLAQWKDLPAPANSELDLQANFAKRILEHRHFVASKLEKAPELGVIGIYCYPPHTVQAVPVSALEKFIQENRYNFSEEIRHSRRLEVLQNGVSLGYFPDGIKKDVKSTFRITLYTDLLVALNSLTSPILRQEGIHGGWISYELLRHLQLAKAYFEMVGLSELNLVVELDNIDALTLNTPASNGLWLERSEYSGPHKTIRRTIKLTYVNSHDSDRRNVVTDIVRDVIAEVYRIFGLSEVHGLWDAEGRLVYVKGLEGQR